MAVSVSQLLYVSALRYLEYLSIITNIYVSLLLFVIGPAESIWISTFGSDSVGSDVCLFFGNFGVKGFNFLAVFVHCLHL